MAPAKGEIGRQVTRGHAMGYADVLQLSNCVVLRPPPPPEVGASSQKTTVSEEKGQ